MLINYYKCSSCSNQWVDVYECEVDMTCSKCGQDNISTYHSEDLPMLKGSMTAKEMSDNDFIQFQDDFYNLLEKYGVKNITCEHEEWQEICKLRNKVVEFIEQELFKEVA